MVYGMGEGEVLETGGRSEYRRIDRRVEFAFGGQFRVYVQGSIICMRCIHKNVVLAGFLTRTSSSQDMNLA